MCTSYIHVCGYTYVCVCELHTCNVHVLCDTHIYVACAVSSYLMCLLPFSPLFLLSLPLTTLPHPYLSPSFTLFSKAILDGRHEMAMLLWSFPNHSPSPPSRAPHGYHIDSIHGMFTLKRSGHVGTFTTPTFYSM